MHDVNHLHPTHVWTTTLPQSPFQQTSPTRSFRRPRTPRQGPAHPLLESPPPPPTSRPSPTTPPQFPTLPRVLRLQDPQPPPTSRPSPSRSRSPPPPPSSRAPFSLPPPTLPFLLPPASSPPLPKARPTGPLQSLHAPLAHLTLPGEAPQAPSPPRTCAQSSPGLHAPAGFAPNSYVPLPPTLPETQWSFPPTTPPASPTTTSPTKHRGKSGFPLALAVATHSLPSPNGCARAGTTFPKMHRRAASGLWVLANMAFQSARVWTTFPRMHE